VAGVRGAEGGGGSRLAGAEKLARARPGRTSWFALFLAWTAGLDDAAAASLAVRLALDRERAALLSGWPAARAAAAQDAGAAEKLSADELLAAASATEDPRIRRPLQHPPHPPPHAPPLRGPDPVREGAPPGPAARRPRARARGARRGGEPPPGPGARSRARGPRGGRPGSGGRRSFFPRPGAPPGAPPPPEPAPTFCVEWIRQSTEGYERLTL